MHPSAASPNQSTILICEATQGPVHRLSDYLAAKGFRVRFISASGPAIEHIITLAPDMVLLDADLPEAGGYEVCRAVRPYYNGKIIIVGPDGDDASELLAFERGADDYVVRPLSPAPLVARIGAHLKQGDGLAVRDAGRQLRVGELLVDASRREVFLAGQPVELTSTQFDLLWHLAKRSGRVVSREELYEAMYDEKYNGFDRSVDVYISRIRQQLGDTADNPSYLKTVRGVGYLLSA